MKNRPLPKPPPPPSLPPSSLPPSLPPHPPFDQRPRFSRPSALFICLVLVRHRPPSTWNMILELYTTKLAVSCGSSGVGTKISRTCQCSVLLAPLRRTLVWPFCRSSGPGHSWRSSWIWCSTWVLDHPLAFVHFYQAETFLPCPLPAAWYPWLATVFKLCFGLSPQ